MAGAFLKKERRLEASFTVEAALVFALVFMVMGMAIKEAYTIHDEITGSMILEEALERASYNRDEKKEDTYFTGQAEDYRAGRGAGKSQDLAGGIQRQA